MSKDNNQDKKAYWQAKIDKWYKSSFAIKDNGEYATNLIEKSQKETIFLSVLNTLKDNFASNRVMGEGEHTYKFTNKEKALKYILAIEKSIDKKVQQLNKQIAAMLDNGSELTINTIPIEKDDLPLKVNDFGAFTPKEYTKLQKAANNLSQNTQDEKSKKQLNILGKEFGYKKQIDKKNALKIIDPKIAEQVLEYNHLELKELATKVEEGKEIQIDGEIYKPRDSLKNILSSYLKKMAETKSKVGNADRAYEINIDKQAGITGKKLTYINNKAKELDSKDLIKNLDNKGLTKLMTTIKVAAPGIIKFSYNNTETALTYQAGTKQLLIEEIDNIRQLKFQQSQMQNDGKNEKEFSHKIKNFTKLIETKSAIEIARMVDKEVNGINVEKNSTRDNEIFTGLLENLPAKHWDKVKTIGNELEKRRNSSKGLLKFKDAMAAIGNAFVRIFKKQKISNPEIASAKDEINQIVNKGNKNVAKLQISKQEQRKEKNLEASKIPKKPSLEQLKQSLKGSGLVHQGGRIIKNIPNANLSKPSGRSK